MGVQTTLSKPIIVNCPSFDEQSGGCVVLHYLAHRLRTIGVEAYIFPLIKEFPPSSLPMFRDIRKELIIREYSRGKRHFRTNPMLDTPVASLDVLRRGIVVYPEIVNGNPLGCPYVARWILFTPRGHKVGEDFARPIPEEAVFFFQLPFIEHIDWIPRANCLRLQWVRDDIFNDPGIVERTEICRMIRKGTVTQNDVPRGALNATILDGMRNEEIAEVFKRAQLFYCHDPYTMYCDYASLCGCTPIVIPPPGLSRTDWRPEEDRLGIAYGDSPDQLDWANRTRPGLIRRIEDLKQQEDKMLKHFVSYLASKFA